MQNRYQKWSSMLGIAAACTFSAAYLICWLLSTEFDPLFDYISKLGVADGSLGLIWNGVGFGLVGILLAGHGLLLGLAYGDRLLAGLLLISGIGFSMAAIPTDFVNEHSAMSRAHYASICICLAGWLCGMARLLATQSLVASTKFAAYTAMSLLLLALVLSNTQASPEPISHRMMLAVAFTWILVNSINSGLGVPPKHAWEN